MKRIVIAAAILLAGCADSSLPPRIETQQVNVAVPVPCGATVDKPAGTVARSKVELGKLLAAAPTVTERARIVSDQLLIWLGYGPKLEVALTGCRNVSQPPAQKVVK